MAILAKAPAQQLLALAEPLLGERHFDLVRAPETGLTQVRARMGGNGEQFNLGDMTLTRCVVRSTEGYLGYSFVAGRNKRHALCAAQLDALLQSGRDAAAVAERVIDPLRSELAQQSERKRQESAATRVDFFTLVRGED